MCRTGRSLLLRSAMGRLSMARSTVVCRVTACWIIIAATLSLACLARAREHAPRIVSEHTADAYSMRTFAEFPRWKDLRGDARVLAVYEYLTDRRTGLYPMGAGAWEGEDTLYEYGYVRDPVKMINVHPMGYCDMLGPVAAAVFEGIGSGPARTVNLPGLHHVFAEVRIGDRWAYVDLDLRGIFRRGDGTLASTEDARREPALWRGPAGPRFFPMDRLEGLREAYARSPVEYRHGVAQGGHTMDYVLRRGETFTRWWKPQGDRWLHHPSFHEALRAVLEREPKGPKCKHGEAYTVHTRGNGRFLYAPDLTSGSPISGASESGSTASESSASGSSASESSSSGSADLDDGVWDSRNVVATPEGLTLRRPGDGFAVFEVRTPYVIVPRVGRYETVEDDREASLVEVEAGGTASGSAPNSTHGLALDVSLDDGISWSELAWSGEPVDLTSLVAGTYGYLLRVRLEGAPGKPVLRRLAIETWVQVHPASLPGLRKGTNRMAYVSGDHHGLPTRVVEIRPNGGDPEDFLKHLVEPPADYDPARSTERVRGPLLARVAAPPGTRIAWISAGASFRARLRDDAPRTANAIALAVGKPEGFREIYRAAIPAGQSHWHTNADVEAMLEEPAREVFLRYVGDPALNDIRIYAHVLDDRPRPRTSIETTHAWREGGELRTKRVRLDGPGAYTIECAEEPEEEWIELRVPGGR